MIAWDSMVPLYLAPVGAVLVTWLAWWARRVRIEHAKRWSRDMAEIATRGGRGAGAALGLAAFLVIAALAGPRFGSRTVTTETKALNLLLAVDISRSMLAEDVSPSRLERVQREAHRLVQDLAGDRIGLIAFAGNSYILSPLTVDDGALRLLIDGLDPTLASVGGTALAKALDQGRQLLLAGTDVADRVLVVFSDGEELDSLPGVSRAAEELRRAGIHVILVAQGGTEPVRIPIRDPDGVLIGYQRDPDNNIVQTSRSDDVLARIADAAHGTVVSAALGDQAGAVRGLVDQLKRSPQATTTAAQDISRAWIPTLAGVLLLLIHTWTRKTAALACLALVFAAPAAHAQRIGNRADHAWREGAFRTAAELYLGQFRAGDGGDTVVLNFGTAALAVGDSSAAREALDRARMAVEPEIRFRALYNLGLLNLRLAGQDSASRTERLETARTLYREALLLRPGDQDAKWNYELAASQIPPPPQGGGDGESDPQPRSGGGEQPQESPVQGLTREQAEQILNSMLEEERRTREEMNRRRSRTGRQRGRKDW